jgi:hypothetical protein
VVNPAPRKYVPYNIAVQEYVIMEKPVDLAKSELPKPSRSVVIWYPCHVAMMSILSSAPYDVKES